MLLAATAIKSPQQAIAEAQPPAAGPVTSAVENRVLRVTVRLRGTVAPETATTVRAPAGRDTTPIVSRLPLRAGETANAGDVVAEVAGRPVLVMPGPTPAYRDLIPGTQGPDVTQLQKALQAQGFRTGSDNDGLFGPGTKAAVTALYAKAGYRPVPTSNDDEEQIRQAQRRLRDAKQAAASGSPPVPQNRAGDGQPAPSGDAKQAVADAQEDLDALIARTGPTIPVGELVFVPALPATVHNVGARLGARAPDVMLTLTSGALIVRADLPAAKAQLVRPDQPVDLVSETLGVTTTGAVAEIAAGNTSSTGASSNDNDADGQQQQGQSATAQEGATGPGGKREVLIRANAPLDPSLAGQNVRVDIVSAATATAVLVVPVAAVSARADGQAQVVCMREGREQTVAVAAGLTDAGYVEVRPIVGATLAAGDRVVIGR